MKRNFINFGIDILTAIAALGMVLTGLVMKYVLPSGGGGGQRSLWNWTRHDWGDLHFWLGVGIVGIALIHVFMHWQWVCRMACACWPFVKLSPDRPKLLSRVVAGVLSVVILTGGMWAFVSYAQTKVVRASGVAMREGGGGRWADHESDRADRPRWGRQNRD